MRFNTALILEEPLILEQAPFILDEFQHCSNIRRQTLEVGLSSTACAEASKVFQSRSGRRIPPLCHSHPDSV